MKVRVSLTILVLFLLVSFAWAEQPPVTDFTPPAAENSAAPAVAAEPAAVEAAPHAQEHAAEAPHHGGVPGSVLPLWTALPFVGILLSIALFPLLAPHFWHHHFGKVSAFWGLVFAIPYLIGYKGAAFYDLLHISLIDYIPFIILLWGLFTVAGGMIVRGTLRGSPGVNLLMLIIGTVLASWVGTTGASMLLIRPMLRANSWRQHKVHVIVFFIFLVSNIGGSLTPLGDPPLFLGFIHGVDFFWTLHLAPVTGFVAAILLVLFYVFDTYYFRKETKQPREDGAKEPLRLDGLHNLIFFGGIMGGVLFSGLVHLGGFQIAGVHMEFSNLVRDGVILCMGALSLYTTKKQLRIDNGFTWGPIAEVAILFAGIFATIIPALSILKAGADGAAAPLVNAVSKPWHFFWVTGGLSSFLDNAPTYLTFFTTAIGKLCPPGIPEKVAAGILMGKASVMAQFPGVESGFKYLEAISAGAVFMGANTYIGNAPNFMVKSIAEETGVKMPSFFGYMFKYSIPILVTTFILTTFIFFV